MAPSVRPTPVALLALLARLALLSLSLPYFQYATYAHAHDETSSSESAESFDHITYYSAIKLNHVPTSFRLHSHKVRYGSGSGQQSVTGVSYAEDDNSMWLVLPSTKPAEKAAPVSRRTRVACGDKIRLRHVKTGTHLHSHKHTSPLSNNQEVSAFEGTDTGDNWELKCIDGSNKSQSKYWGRKSQVALRHLETDCYLVSNARYRYNSPINGHLEISCAPASSSSSSNDRKWVTGNGYFFGVSSPKASQSAAKTSEEL